MSILNREPKGKIGLRLSNETIKQIKLLSVDQGRAEADVVEAAVERYYQYFRQEQEQRKSRSVSSVA